MMNHRVWTSEASQHVLEKGRYLAIVALYCNLYSSCGEVLLMFTRRMGACVAPTKYCSRIKMWFSPSNDRESVSSSVRSSSPRKGPTAAGNRFRRAPSGYGVSVQVHPLRWCGRIPQHPFPGGRAGLVSFFPLFFPTPYWGACSSASHPATRSCTLDQVV